MANRPLRHLAVTALLLAVVAACESEEKSVDTTTDASDPSSEPDEDPTASPTTSAPVLADDIPVAHTPEGGWTGPFPDPVLASCTEPLVGGAPDLRGMWKVVEVIDDSGAALSDHAALGLLQRIEQCGDRVVVTAGGVVHDMRCDGTEANGVHDVAEFDMATRIDVVASYEDGVHVLRPVGLPIEVRRWRDGEDVMWKYLGFTARMERIGPPEMQPAAEEA
jgi:hypothetical protein